VHLILPRFAEGCLLVEVTTAACFVAQTRNGALALTSLGLPAVCLNLLESNVEAVQLASCRLLLGIPVQMYKSVALKDKIHKYSF